MAELKATPGPWREEIGTLERFLILDADDSLIAWVTYRDEDTDTNDRVMQEANAQLIATAPHLYQACADAEAVYEECRETSTEEYTDEVRQRLVALMIAAVKGCTAAARKARGEEA